MKVGTTVVFKGYESLEEGQEPIFSKDQVLVLVEDNGEGEFKAHLEGDESVFDTVFDTEVSEITAKVSGGRRARGPKAEKAESEKTEKATKTQEAAKSTKSTKSTKSAKPTKPTKPTKAEPLKSEERESPEIVDTKTVQALLKKTNPLTAAKSLMTTAEEAYFSLGGILAHVYYEKAYATIKREGVTPYPAGRPGFEAYVMDELGIAYRKAMYLINIYMHFSYLGVDEKSLSSLGWSKAKEIVSATAALMEEDKEAAADSVKELLEFAKGKSREELITHIRESFADVSTDGRRTADVGARAKKVKFAFALFEDKAEVAKAILATVAETIGSDNMNEQMDYIFTQFAAMSGIEIAAEALTESEEGEEEEVN